MLVCCASVVVCSRLLPGGTSRARLHATKYHRTISAVVVEGMKQLQVEQHVVLATVTW